MGEGKDDLGKTSGKMTKSKEGTISSLFGALKKKRKRKEKINPVAAEALKLHQKLLVVVSQTEPGKQAQGLMDDLTNLRDRAKTTAKATEQQLDDLEQLEGKVTKLLDIWEVFKSRLHAEKLRLLEEAQASMAIESDRFARLVVSAKTTLRVHPQSVRDQLATEIDKVVTQHSRHQTSLADKKTCAEIDNPAIDGPAFRKLLDQVTQSFRTEVEKGETAITNLMKTPGRNKNDRDDFVSKTLKKLDDNHPSGLKQLYEASKTRLETAKQEAETLSSAMDSINKRMAELKILRTGETPDALVERLTKEVKDHTTKKTDAEQALQLVKQGTVPKGTDAVAETKRLESLIVELGDSITKKQEIIDHADRDKDLIDRDRVVSMSLDGKKKLETEYNALKLQLEGLTARQKMMKEMSEGGDRRIDAMMTAYEEREQQADAVDSLASVVAQRKVDTSDKAFGFLDGVDLVSDVPDSVSEWKKSLVEENADLKQQVDRIHATIDRGQRLSPLEPEVPRISKAERDLLIKLLDDVAMKLIKSGELELAARTHMKVRQLLIDFQADTARQLVLPVPPTETVDREKILTTRCKLLEPTLLDLVARGTKGDGGLSAVCTKLLDDIKSEAAEIVPDWAPLETRVIDLERKTKEAGTAEAEISNDLHTAREKAGKLRNQINADLVKLMNCERIDPSKFDLIDRPGKIWPMEKGKPKKPKNAIPYDDVIYVNEGGVEVPYRIKTKDPGGVDKVRRGDGHHHVPREMMAMIRSDAEALELMMSSEVEDMAKVTEAYIKTAKERLDAVMSPTANKDYEAVEDTMEKINDRLTKSPIFSSIFGQNAMVRMHPEGLETLKKQVEEFKKNWPKMLPAEAKKAAQDLYQQVKDKQEEAEKLEKTYETSKAQANKAIADFKDPEVGMSLELDFASGRAGEILERFGDKLSKKERKALETSLQKAGGNWDYRGEWMTEMQSGYRLLKQKSTESVAEGKKKVEEAIKKRDAFRDDHYKMVKLLNKKDKDLTDPEKQELLDLARRTIAVMEDAEAGSQKHDDLLRTWMDKRKTVRELLNAAEKHSKDKPQKKILESRLSGLSKTYEAVKKEVVDFEDYAAGCDDLDQIIKDLTALVEDAKADGTKKGGEIGKPVAEDRANKVDAWLKKLQVQVPKLNAQYLQGLAEGTQKNDMDDAFKAVETSMALAASSIGTAAELVKACKSVDEGIEGQVGHAELLKRREVALTEVRRLRDKLNANPVLKLYGENPFPDHKPTTVMLAMGAIHNCEIAILSSVDPRSA